MATHILTYPRFIIAKYVPDLRRMEPKNIGVFLWAKGILRYRFLDSTPEFVKDAATYQRWLTFWQTQISNGSIAPKRGEPVRISDPKSVDALISTQKGEYLLVEAGELVDNIAKRDIENATAMLFDQLVGSTTERMSAAASHQTLESVCSRLLTATLKERQDFHLNYPLECPVYGVSKRLRFHYGVGNGNGSTKALIQRVNMGQDASVHNAALMVHCATDSALISRRHCAVLYQGSADGIRRDNLRLLRKVCRIIDVDKDDKASEALIALPAA